MADLQHIGPVSRVHIEEVNLPSPFPDLAEKFASLPGTVALLSGGDLDSARYHMLAVFPWLSLTGRDKNFTLTVDGGSLPVEENPFSLIQKIIDACHLPQGDYPLPVTAGLFGYLAYDLKDSLETLPRTSLDDLSLPHLCLYAPKALLVQDRMENRSFLCIPERTGIRPDEVRKDFFEALTAPPPSPAEAPPGSIPGGSNFSRKSYMAAVDRARAYIRSGDVYQVNLAQRFLLDFAGVPFDLFRELFDLNPAPFFAFIQAGDHQILSSSPERFIRSDGKRVETRPIKGTAPRGKAPREDATLKEKLLASRKEDAELSMIVDLLRNDIGKVCRAGSVKVSEHKRLESYRNVHHLVSIVEGELQEGTTCADILTAVFPGGSITGCPKIRAMELIDELEPNRRHIYTGSIGYLSFHDTLDLSIAIRTATVINGKLLYSVGGGIVLDSDPAGEYEETLHKGETIALLCRKFSPPPKSPPIVWKNGRLVAEPLLPAAIPGVTYGFGLFETIRAEKGVPRHLEAHMARFASGWKALFPGPVPELSFEDIIARVLAANSLSDQTAAVKIFAAAGTRTEAPFDHQVLVSARPYVHRLAGKKELGLHLAAYPEARQTPLAAYKTSNYLFYYLAGKWAKEKGADEALILNPDGSISESNSASIIVIQGKQAMVPTSPHVLPGVMQGKVLQALVSLGFTVREEKLFPDALPNANMVLLTNALMGTVPVSSLNGKGLPMDAALCGRIHTEVEGGTGTSPA